MASAQSIQLDKDTGRPVNDDGSPMTQKEFNDAMNSKNGPGEKQDYKLPGGKDGSPGDNAPASDADAPPADAGGSDAPPAS
jgi:hypothetical protein